MDRLLYVENLTAGYGRRNVLKDIGFSVQRGEIYALLGSNGCGKSTLLRSICHLMPAQGHCTLEGEELWKMEPRRRAQKIGYLSQQKSEPPELEALEVVLMGYNSTLKLFQKPSQQQKQRAQQLLRKLNAQAFANQNFATLSEGQRQLVLFARTLVQNPALLILDEPDSALDYVNRHRVLRYLKEYVRSSGSGILLCSHDVNIALRYADKLLLLKDGTITQKIELCKTNPQELADALSKLYGRVKVLLHDGYYLMTEAEQQ